MKSTVIILLYSLTLLPLMAQEESFAIPDDLLEDEHVREEFGINEFTTPSIRKIFDTLKELRPLPYGDLRRETPAKPAKDRTLVAVSLGYLIADGFYAVEAEQFLDLEPVGRSLLEHAKAIGAGKRIKAHTAPLLDHQNLKDWDKLKGELAKAQNDVEKEMVLIRDVDLAHLIALGGWLRAFEIGCSASLDPYDATKAAVMAKPEVVEYFAVTLETMIDRLQSKDQLSDVLKALKAIQEKVTVEDQETISEETVKEMLGMVSPIADKLYGPKLQPVVEEEEEIKEEAIVVEEDEEVVAEEAEEIVTEEKDDDDQ